MGFHKTSSGDRMDKIPIILAIRKDYPYARLYINNNLLCTAKEWFAEKLNA